MNRRTFIKLSSLSIAYINSTRTQIIAQNNQKFDIVVYGGTSAGVIAAVQAAKMKKSVVVISPDKHLGGLSSSGLGWTDSGKKHVIGGLAKEYYHRIWLHYQNKEAWKWEEKSKFSNKGQGIRSMDDETKTMWTFEPHVAEKVFDDLIRENKIKVYKDEWLDRDKGVVKKNDRIISITTLSGKKFFGKMFIDATYEGDLMATADVKYHVGREACSTYNEEWNGIQVGVLHHKHFFGEMNIDPYIIPGDPSSGVLPRISPDPPGNKCDEDKRIQAYCFRMCLTKHPDNKRPFPKPVGYDPKQYALLVRTLKEKWKWVLGMFCMIPNKKTDKNNRGPFSTDNIGMNYKYPEGSYKERKEIIKEHEIYQKGLMYFMANDPQVPEELRKEISQWGLAKDEFVDNDNWPHQLYIREARRMVGSYVITENDVLGKRDTPQSVGMGSYSMDSHNVQRYIKPDGYVENEGDIGVGVPNPYKIAFGSLIPKIGECNNLLVPVCASSSHIAFGSIRMEPVFMILGQSSATAASIAIDDKKDIQDIDYKKLKKRLLEDKQVLDWEKSIKVDKIKQKKLKLDGIVIDDEEAELKGTWKQSHLQGLYGKGYKHDDNTEKGKSSARFTAKLQKGLYEVIMYYKTHNNRSSTTPVKVIHAEGVKELIVDQRKNGEKGYKLGVFKFNGSGTVIVSNKNTKGHVIIDAIQFLRKK